MLLLCSSACMAQIPYYSTGIPGAKDYTRVGFLPGGTLSLFTGPSQLQQNLQLLTMVPEYPDYFIVQTADGVQYLVHLGASHIELQGITKPYRKVFAFERVDCTLCDKTPEQAMQHARAYTIGNMPTDSKALSAERMQKVVNLAVKLITIASKL